jgi:hypothetical protein
VFYKTGFTYLSSTDFKDDTNEFAVDKLFLQHINEPALRSCNVASRGTNPTLATCLQSTDKTVTYALIAAIDVPGNDLGPKPTGFADIQACAD